MAFVPSYFYAFCYKRLLYATRRKSYSMQANSRQKDLGQR